MRETGYRTYEFWKPLVEQWEMVVAEEVAVQRTVAPLFADVYVHRWTGEEAGALSFVSFACCGRDTLCKEREGRETYSANVFAVVSLISVTGRRKGPRCS